MKVSARIIGDERTDITRQYPLMENYGKCFFLFEGRAFSLSYLRTFRRHIRFFLGRICPPLRLQSLYRCPNRERNRRTACRPRYCRIASSGFAVVGQYGISAGTKLRSGVCGTRSNPSRTLCRRADIRLGSYRSSGKDGNGYDPAGIFNAGSAA